MAGRENRHLRRRCKQTLHLATVAAAALAARPTLAGLGTWQPTAGGEYTWNTPSNWSGTFASGSGYPNDIADSATFNLDLAANQTINLSAPVTISGLTLTDSNTATSGTYNVVGSTLTFARSSGSVTLNNVTGGNTIATDVVLSNSLTITGAGELSLSGNISGAGGIGRANGRVILTGSNSYTGVTSVTNAVSFNSIADVGAGPSALGNPSLANSTISAGGTLTYIGSGHSSNRIVNLTASLVVEASGAAAITLSGGMTRTGAGQNLTLRGAGNGSVTGVIDTGTGTVTQTAGVWTLNGANVYTGRTLISGGTLATTLLASGAIASGVGASNSDAANLVLNGGSLQYLGAGISINRGYTLSIGSAGTGTLDASGIGALTVGGQMVNSGTGAFKTLFLTGTNTGANTLVAPILDGAGVVTTRLTKTGTGTWALAGENAYTNSTNVQGGTLVLLHAKSVPGGIALTGGTSHLNLDGGVVGLGAGNFGRSLGTGVTAVQFGSSGGFAAFGADRTVNLGEESAVVTWNSGNFVPTNSSLLLGAATATHTLDFQNPISFNSNLRTIDVANGGAGIDGLLSGQLTSATGGFNKLGAGTLAVTGDNTYGGGTSITAGRLLVNNATGSGTGSGALNVGGGTLGGIGRVNGALTVTAGGTLAPGVATGSLTAAGGVTLHAGSSFAVDVNGASTFAGTGNHDQLILPAGDLQLGGTLSAALGYAAMLGDVVFLIDNQAGATSGQFTGLADNSIVTQAGGLGWLVTYDANIGGVDPLNGGNDVALYYATVPEPAAASLVGAAAVLLGRRRRSRP